MSRFGLYYVSELLIKYGLDVERTKAQYELDCFFLKECGVSIHNNMLKYFGNEYDLNSDKVTLTEDGDVIITNDSESFLFEHKWIKWTDYEEKTKKLYAYRVSSPKDSELHQIVFFMQDQIKKTAYPYERAEKYDITYPVLGDVAYPSGI